ncbi:MAG: hypothetical protein GX804_11630 [Lentisphaerae bacterium]|nr:hypothetical protein [Lentisphaerota bacterium]
MDSFYRNHRLSDSLPKEKVARLATELQHIDPEKQDIERQRRLDALVDAGYGAHLSRSQQHYQVQVVFSVDHTNHCPTRPPLRLLVAPY